MKLVYKKKNKKFVFLSVVHLAFRANRLTRKEKKEVLTEEKIRLEIHTDAHRRKKRESKEGYA